MFTEETIQFKTLSVQLYDYLSNSIIEGHLKPGEGLIENDLRERFGISRSPIRECFRILESEGLITIVPRKGTFVRRFTGKEIKDVFPVRAYLESLAAKLATPHIGDKEITILDDLIKKMGNSISNNRVKSFLRHNYNFHTLFIKASKNDVLEKTLVRRGKGFWLRIAFLYYQSPSQLIFSNKMHKDILEAFKKGDARSAERLVRKHIEHAKWPLVKFFGQDVSPNNK
ncbi:GntR family transcriptional regulator [bacterium]|nr:GntR family transcriptional regulator [bacterium]